MTSPAGGHPPQARPTGGEPPAGQPTGPGSTGDHEAGVNRTGVNRTGGSPTAARPAGGQPARGLSRALRAGAYRAFYRLPSRWRRALVRLLVPRYTVGAVTLVRDADAPPPGRLLLLRQPPGYGWTLPGGLLNRHEPPAVGAARELAEETGIRLAPEQLRELAPNAVVHTDGHWIDLVFEVHVPSTIDVVVDGAEVYEAGFHALDALPRLTAPTARLLSYFGIGPYVGSSHPRAGSPEART